MKNYSHAMFVEILKFRIEVSDGIGRSNNDVSFDWDRHCRKLAHSSVINLSGISIEGVQKLEWQVSAKRKWSKPIEEHFAVLNERLILVTHEAQGVENFQDKYWPPSGVVPHLTGASVEVGKICQNPQQEVGGAVKTHREFNDAYQSFGHIKGTCQV